MMQNNMPNNINDFDLEDDLDNVAEKMAKGKRVATIITILILIITILVLGLLLVLKDQKFKRDLEEKYKEGYNAGRGQEEIIINPEITVEKATIIEVLKSVRELTVDKYIYTDIGIYEKDSKFFNTGITVPFTTDKTVYAYRGTIGIGIKDINNAEIEINNDKHVISIKVPKAEILYHEFNNDEFKTYDVKNSIFTETSLSDYSQFEDELKKSQEKLLLSDKRFWNEANDNIVDAITDLMKLYDFASQYEIKVTQKN